MSLSAQYFRSGKCAVCGGSAERFRTFIGQTLMETDHQAGVWGTEPLRHKRCEETS